MEIPFPDQAYFDAVRSEIERLLPHIRALTNERIRIYYKIEDIERSETSLLGFESSKHLFTRGKVEPNHALAPGPGPGKLTGYSLELLFFTPVACRCSSGFFEENA